MQLKGRQQHPLFLALVAGVLGAGLLTACGASSSTTTSTSSTPDPLTFQTSSLPVAYTGEDFQASVTVLGGVGPYSYRVAGGALPPGLRLSGGIISGKPAATGAYKFTIEAADANLSTKVYEYTLNVNDLPPLSLAAELPQGEIRGETRVPLTILAPRTVRAARVVWDLGENVTVSKVQPTDPGNVVFWKQSGQILTIDIGFKTVPQPSRANKAAPSPTTSTNNGIRVALVSVKPSKPVTLSASNFWYDSRDATGKVLGEKKRPAPAVAKPVTTTPAATTPTATPAVTAPTTTPATTPATTSAPQTETTPVTPATTPTTTPATPTDPTTPTTTPVTPTPGVVK